MSQEKKPTELDIRKEIMETLRPAFECQTCKAFPILESFGECDYCNGTRGKINQCQCPTPKCRNGHPTNKTIHINSYKKVTWQIDLLKTTPHPCKNGKYGCEEIRMLDQLTLHEETCDYRKVHCVVKNCDADVCWIKYMEHFDEHKMLKSLLPFPYEKKMNFDFSYDLMEHRTPNTFVAFKRTFFEVCHLQNGFVYLWIFLLGFKDEAKKFYYQATITNSSNDKDFRTFNGQVRSMDETTIDIIAQQNCFVIGQVTCNNFKSRQDNLPDLQGMPEGFPLKYPVFPGMIKYQIELRNLKEEAKDEDEESGISDNDD